MQSEDDQKTAGPSQPSATKDPLTLTLPGGFAKLIQEASLRQERFRWDASGKRTGLVAGPVYDAIEEFGNTASDTAKDQLSVAVRALKDIQPLARVHRRKFFEVNDGASHGVKMRKGLFDKFPNLERADWGYAAAILSWEKWISPEAAENLYKPTQDCSNEAWQSRTQLFNAVQELSQAQQALPLPSANFGMQSSYPAPSSPWQLEMHGPHKVFLHSSGQLLSLGTALALSDLRMINPNDVGGINETDSGFALLGNDLKLLTRTQSTVDGAPCILYPELPHAVLDQFLSSPQEMQARPWAAIGQDFGRMLRPVEQMGSNAQVKGWNTDPRLPAATTYKPWKLEWQKGIPFLRHGSGLFESLGKLLAVDELGIQWADVTGITEVGSRKLAFRNASNQFLAKDGCVASPDGKAGLLSDAGVQLYRPTSQDSSLRPGDAGFLDAARGIAEAPGRAGNRTTAGVSGGVSR